MLRIPLFLPAAITPFSFSLFPPISAWEILYRARLKYAFTDAQLVELEGIIKNKTKFKIFRQICSFKIVYIIRRMSMDDREYGVRTNMYCSS